MPVHRPRQHMCQHVAALCCACCNSAASFNSDNCTGQRCRSQHAVCLQAAALAHSRGTRNLSVQPRGSRMRPAVMPAPLVHRTHRHCHRPRTGQLHMAALLQSACTSALASLAALGTPMRVSTCGACAQRAPPPPLACCPIASRCVASSACARNAHAPSPAAWQSHAWRAHACKVCVRRALRL